MSTFLLPTSQTGKLLLICNVAVALYALARGWSPANLVLLYWLESLIIIAFSFFKELYLNLTVGPRPLIALTIFCYFIYLGISLAHFHLVRSLFENGIFPKSMDINFSALTASVSYALALSWIAPAVLLFHHAFSATKNFVIQAEYKSTPSGFYLLYPAWRIYILHALLIFCGSIWLAATSLGFSNDVAVMILFICLKTAGDVKLHELAHRQIITSS